MVFIAFRQILTTTVRVLNKDSVRLKVLGKNWSRVGKFYQQEQRKEHNWKKLNWFFNTAPVVLKLN